MDPGYRWRSEARQRAERGAQVGVARTIGSVKGETLRSLRRAEPALSVDLVQLRSLLRHQAVARDGGALLQLHRFTGQVLWACGTPAPAAQGVAQLQVGGERTRTG